VAEAEAAGGSPRKKPPGSSPRKKPRSEGTFLLCLDRAKATAEHGRMEPFELEGYLEEWAEGRRPRKAPPKTTKPPPITQEDDGYDDLASEEEKFDEDNVNDEEVDANDVAPRDEAFVESILARPHGAKQDSGAHDSSRPKENDGEEIDASCDGVTRKAIPASPRGTKRGGGKNDPTDGGGRPKNALKTTGDDKEFEAGDIGDLDDDDEDPDYGDIEAQVAAEGAALRR